MPGGISKLKHLSILYYFVVGKQKDCGIQELGGLSDLKGSFEILKLENVVDVRQAKSARMLEKNHIDNLSLEWGAVTYCDKLEALPRDMKSLLTSLQSLKIYGCPNICRLPKGGLPPNLKSLVVGIGEQQTRDLSWMANLHALTHLEIYGEYCDNIKSYPEVGSLPHLPSLTTLEILHFRKLETLECNELLRLTSLQQLHIYRCPKLENMEGEKLPPSLLLLEVFHCHLLEKHCKNKHQLIWHKISHIPSVKFFE
ncbi:hypothetical protein AHAS_Ahas12G0005300 [Arachis hypogaea]